MDRLDALTATEEDLEADARRQQDFASGLTRRQRKKGKLQVLEASVRRIEELQGVQQEVQSLRARVAELMQERREDDALSFLNHVPALRERWRRDDSAAALHSSLLVQVHFSLVIADVADVYTCKVLEVNQSEPPSPPVASALPCRPVLTPVLLLLRCAQLLHSRHGG